MPKVSVVIPVYNVERYVAKCAHSLFRQTLNDVEYIFVDDCTPDKSIEIVKEVLLEYPNRTECVKIVRHNNNQGLPAARLSGIQYATGDYIIHSDSDDWMEPNMLESMYRKAIETGADCVYCDFNFVKASGIERYFAPKSTGDKSEILEKWVNSTWTVIWNVLAKRELYVKNEVKFPIGVKFCEDFYVAIQLLCFATNIEHVAHPLHNYNMLNNTSILHTTQLQKMWQDQVWVYSNILTFLKEKKFFKLCDRSISWRYLNSIQGYVLDKQNYKTYKNLHPETHKFVWSCPYLNVKVKCAMWCLDHNLDFVVFLFIVLRNIFKR